MSSRFTILGLTDEGNAILDTNGLFRVIINPGAEIVEEMLTANEAAAYVEDFNRRWRGYRAEAVGYLSTHHELIGN